MALRLISLFIGGAFVLLIIIYAVSDLVAVTGGSLVLIGETFAVAYAASAVVTAALVLVLKAGAALQRRLGGPADPKRPVSIGRWAGIAAALAWVAFVTAPFLAPSVVAGDWIETLKLTSLVGALIIGFLAVVVLWAILAEARRRCG